jgi:hypothetical protein
LPQKGFHLVCFSCENLPDGRSLSPPTFPFHERIVHQISTILRRKKDN